MTLRPFQEAASAFLQARSVAMLCDDAGLGKSASVLDACDKIGAQRVLCVGPAVAGVSWPIEIRKWSKGRKFVDLDLGNRFGFDLPGFYFVSYDMLSRKENSGLVAELSSCRPWDVLVLDEGQYLKNFGSNRTQAVYGTPGSDRDAIYSNAERTWVLSGTLTPNHAGEIFPHAVSLVPSLLRTVPAFKDRTPEQYEFENHFCRVKDTVYGRSIQGSKNQAELRAALAPVLLRRRKIDVMPELPPMEWFTAPVKLDAGVVRGVLMRALAGNLALADEIRSLADDEAVTQFVASNANLATARRELGTAKVGPCVDWIEERLAAGEPKIIVFAHHKDVIKGLYEGLLNHSPVLYTGDTQGAERAAAVDTFQNNPNCRVFIGQIVAAGTAITLTAAKTVFFAEYASTPGVNYQAASRAHRMGQRDGVQVYFGSVPGSLDETIAATAARRAREIAELFD